MSTLDKIREFFKKDVLDEHQVETIDDIIDLPVISLLGISRIHADKLNELGIDNIKDIAEASEVPDLKDLPERIFLKWQRTATMLLDYATRPKEKKIIILGLDNAGKTSILSVLQNKYSIIKNLLPTRGVSRQTLEFLGTSVIAWDFGGQLGYRSMYLSRPDLFLESDLCVFVIDVLDTERYDESFEYLFNILETIKDLEDIPPIIIDLHKFDPDIATKPEITEKRSELIDKIATKVLQENYECTFINTTIFLRETIEEFFSLAVQKMSATNFLLEHIMKDFVTDVGAKAIALMTDSNFIVGSYSESEEYKTIVTQTGLLLQALTGFYQKTGFKEDKSYELNLHDNDITIYSKQLYPYKEDKLSLWLVFEGEPPQELEGLEIFKSELKPILEIY